MDPSQVNSGITNTSTQAGSATSPSTNSNTGYYPASAGYSNVPQASYTTATQGWDSYQRQLEQQQQGNQHLLPPPPPPPHTQQPLAPQQQQPQQGPTRRTTRGSKALQQQQQQGYQNIVPAITSTPSVKREQGLSASGAGARDSNTMSSSSTRGDSKEGVVAATGSGAAHHDDPMPSTSDFVKKLYKCVYSPRCFFSAISSPSSLSSPFVGVVLVRSTLRLPSLATLIHSPVSIPDRSVNPRLTSHVYAGCSKTQISRTSSRGDPKATASS